MSSQADGDPSEASLQAVVLDMDGLLMDTEPVWRMAEGDVFAELGVHLSEAEMLSTMGRRVTEVVAHWRRHRPWPGAETGEPSDETIAGRVIDRLVAQVRERGEPMPGVRQAISLLRHSGVRLAIASSSPHRLIDAVLGRLDLEWIEVRCSAVDEARGKPAADVYLAAARLLDLSPTACLAIEDSPNGVLSAKAAGMRCIAVPDPLLADDPRYRQADKVLTSLADLNAAVLTEMGWREAPASEAAPGGTMPPWAGESTSTLTTT